MAKYNAGAMILILDLGHVQSWWGLQTRAPWHSAFQQEHHHPKIAYSLNMQDRQRVYGEQRHRKENIYGHSHKRVPEVEPMHSAWLPTCAAQVLEAVLSTQMSCGT